MKQIKAWYMFYMLKILLVRSYQSLKAVPLSQTQRYKTEYEKKLQHFHN